MSAVNKEVFAEQLFAQEGIILIYTKPFTGELRSYSEAYPKALGDGVHVARLYARLITLLPKGTWTIRRSDNQIIHNRKALMGGLRNPPPPVTAMVT